MPRKTVLEEPSRDETSAPEDRGLSRSGAAPDETIFADDFATGGSALKATPAVRATPDETLFALGDAAARESTAETPAQAPPGADATLLSPDFVQSGVVPESPDGDAADEATVVGGEPAAAATSPDGAASDAVRTGVSHAGGGLLFGVVSDLVAEGLIPERKAVSIALQARDSGETFFRLLAQDPMIGGSETAFRRIFEYLGYQAITDHSDLLERVELVDWLSLEVAERIGILVLGSFDPDVTEYAALDPFDLVARDWVLRMGGQTCTPIPVLPSVFSETIDSLKQRHQDPDAVNDTIVSVNMSWEEEQDIKVNVEDCNVPQIVNYILYRSVTQGASDVHFEPTNGRLLVRNRIDGILHEEVSLPIDLHPPIIARIKVLSGMDLAEKRRPQDGRVSARITDHPIDVRVSSLPTVNGEKMVLRLLDEGALLPKIDQVGLVQSDLDLVHDKISAPHGLIMISGPTGSGKTTTLYSCLAEIDRNRKNVVTVEDPVEYRLKGVHQMQINEKIGLSFASGLRTLLRQDPDVIMVGECRDAETANIAIQASLTGHIVFTTIHTNDSVGVVARLIDMGVDPFLAANALRVAIAQRLVRLVCPHCRSMETGEAILEQLSQDGVSQKKLDGLNITIRRDLRYPHAAGCSRCRHTGYSGRQGVFEVLNITDDCRNLIVSEGFSAPQLAALGREQGMTPMIESCLRLVEEGRTTHEELLRVLGDG